MLIRRREDKGTSLSSVNQDQRFSTMQIKCKFCLTNLRWKCLSSTLPNFRFKLSNEAKDSLSLRIMRHICCRIYDTRNHVPYLLPYIWYTESCDIFVALYMIHGIMCHICCPIYDTWNHAPYLLPYIWYMESCTIFVALYKIHFLSLIRQFS